MHIWSNASFTQKSRAHLLLLLLWTSVFFTAPTAIADSNIYYNDPLQSEYYTIEEAPADSLNVAAPEMSPLSHFSAATFIATARRMALNLLRWTLHTDPPEVPQEKYNRKFHFGRWINDPFDDTCYNTRAKVLIRDSAGPVSFKERNRCIVETGDWKEPYAGQEVTKSREIQIDHMVPLKNAYVSGAWEWDFQTRCMYANFMGNKFHLVSSGGIENMRKGDRAPDRYMPPNLSYRCEYLENWLKIKLIWRLKMTSTEVTAIRKGIEENGCNPKNFSLTQLELRQQRKLINEQNDVCPVR